MISVILPRNLLIVAALASSVGAWEVCPCGYYCATPVPAGYLSRVECRPGHYCPQGAFHASSKAVLCPAGQLCPKSKLCAPLGCPCGSYCPPGSSQAVQCSEGTYCPANSSAPVPCSSTLQCPDAGLCAPTATCGPAVCVTPFPPGFICSTDPAIGCGLICVDTAACNLKGTTLPPVTGAHVTTQPSKVAITSTPPVAHCGYSSVPGSSLQVPCRPGTYCPIGSRPLPCPAGSYCPQATCAPLNCTCGFYCPPASSAPTECLAPFYCPGNGNSHQTLCPIGSKCPDKHMCAPIPCLPGSHMPCDGRVTCTPCSRGRYCPDPTHSVLCPLDFYCPPGASAPLPCPAGFQCHKGSWVPEPLPRILEGSSAPP